MAEESKKRKDEIYKLVLEFEMKMKNDVDMYYDSESYEKIIKWYIDNHKFKLGLKAVNFALSQHLPNFRLYQLYQLYVSIFHP